MDLKETLKNQLKEAMRNKDTVQKNVVQLIRAAILQKEKDSQATLDDEGILDIIARQLKQRKDALADFTKAGRQDLIDLTNQEIELLSAYLPKQMDDEELEAILREVISQTKPSGIKEIGKVMGAAMPLAKGRADGKRINEMARRILSEGGQQ